MPRLSVVIPAVGSIESLESTLVSVLENRPDDCEIVVVLNQEYGDPYSLTGEVRFVAAERGASYSRCANEGIRQSLAPIVHLLASGCEVAEGWADAALARFDDRLVAAVSPALFDRLRPERMIALGVGYSLGGHRRLISAKPADARMAESALAEKRRQTVLGPAASAAFFRRVALETCGLLCESLGASADVDLALALRNAGWRSVVQPQSLVYVGPGVVLDERGFSGAVHAERLFWRNVALAGRGRSLASHPFSVGVDWVRSLPEWGGVPNLLGRLVGLSTARQHLRPEDLATADAGPVGAPSAMPFSPAATPAPSQRRIDGPHGMGRQESAARGVRARAG